jgi:hypothetical protein
MRIRALTLLALALQLQGCFVFDEIDKGQAMMSKPSAAKEKEAAVKAKAEAGEKAPSWWEKAGTLAPGEGDATIVGCRLSGKLQFMREADCLTRGGRPQRG